jgi:hypothetical protein
VRQALYAMHADPGLTWWLLPGNHDSLAAGDLWQRIARDSPPNVRPLLTPEPVAMAPGAWLLPAPCTQRRPGRDLTAGMDATATPAGASRIGLAQGAVQSFSEDANPAQIPPDRAASAGLAFLALGDRHGQLAIGPRTWYAGAPEADGFKHTALPGALLVDVGGPYPQVTPLPTGTLAWQSAVLDLLPADDPAPRLAALLPPVASRRDTLLQITATGSAQASPPRPCSSTPTTPASPTSSPPSPPSPPTSRSSCLPAASVRSPTSLGSDRFLRRALMRNG